MSIKYIVEEPTTLLEPRKATLVVLREREVDEPKIKKERDDPGIKKESDILGSKKKGMSPQRRR
jgi:hypothetical protein